MGLTEFLAGYITHIMASAGLPSVIILMAMESMIFPIPSEAVMPFAGYLVAGGTFSLVAVIIASTIGSIIGSLISYWIGAWGGKPFIQRFGKYFLLNQYDLEKTENYFAKKGDTAVFICRFIPIVRHLISLPAGVGRMNVKKFLLYTTLGAGVWNTFLTLCGFYLKQNWETVMRYSKIVDLIVIATIIFFVIYIFFKHFKKQSISNIQEKL